MIEEKEVGTFAGGDAASLGEVLGEVLGEAFFVDS